MPLELVLEPTELPRPFLRGEKSAGETGNIERAMGIVGRHRKLDCFNYDACLSYASIRNWGGWSCRQCRLWIERTTP